MPELPEAEVAAAQLRQKIVGSTVRDCWVGRSDIIREGGETVSWYGGSRIEAVERRGKTVVISFSRDGEIRFLAAELGMTGLLLFRSAPMRLPQHTHFVMKLEGSLEPELRYWNPRRFGRLCLFDMQGLDRYCRRRFGQDPLTITGEQLRALMAMSRGRLKPFLMNQQKLAGIGNIYANEILFRAGLHPNRVAGRLRLSEIDALHACMQKVLLEAIQSGGSSVRDFFAPDGTLGTYRVHHRVYGKSGERCPNSCGSLLKHLSQERSSFFCPTCQPNGQRTSSTRRLLTSRAGVP
ncbi:MAG TPA: bifunctional DNA-formamidopyrimidine glycosylase/DNA-(apurinic or apyrimidinic site) lyase [Nitrospiraceae bacterium]|nr:bifunctional DNA-formamidopyrimidine glycosylase/DNA-(apurinic or apyrimidinic site) lyase [Nitrospiraceae bacterium]